MQEACGASVGGGCLLIVTCLLVVGGCLSSPRPADHHLPSWWPTEHSQGPGSWYLWEANSRLLPLPHVGLVGPVPGRHWELRLLHLLPMDAREEKTFTHRSMAIEGPHDCRWARGHVCFLVLATGLKASHHGYVGGRETEPAIWE